MAELTSRAMGGTVLFQDALDDFDQLSEVADETINNAQHVEEDTGQMPTRCNREPVNNCKDFRHCCDISHESYSLSSVVSSRVLNLLRTKKE